MNHVTFAPTSLPPAINRLSRLPSHREIADRAYAHFQARGEGDGDHVQDWLNAERELIDERDIDDERDDPFELER